MVSQSKPFHALAPSCSVKWRSARTVSSIFSVSISMVHRIHGRRSGVVAPRFSNQKSHDLPDFCVGFGRHRNSRIECPGAGRRSHCLRERSFFRTNGGNRRAYRRKDSSCFRAGGPSGRPGRCTARRARPKNKIRGIRSRRNFNRRFDVYCSAPQSC